VSRLIGEPGERHQRAEDIDAVREDQFTRLENTPMKAMTDISENNL
jgi:hypothetical protein